MTDVLRHDDGTAWDQLVRANNGHPLQLWGWGEVKHLHGWKAVRLQIGKGGAQVLLKRMPGPMGPLAYIPRGPFGDALSDEGAREALVAHLKTTYRPVACLVEPDTEGELKWKGWRRTVNNVLIPRTAVLDLSQPEEAMLAAMTKKTRQYIRKSEKEQIVIETAQSKQDIDECLKIYRETAKRAGFDLHDDSYYHDIFEKLDEDSPVFMARHGKETVAFLWPIVTPEVAFELYGGMNDKGQALRANYILKWRVIQSMRQRGVKRYDVNGLLNDGVTTFKKGFIPEETMLSGSYARPLSPWYGAWEFMLPLAKRLLRLKARLRSIVLGSSTN